MSDSEFERWHHLLLMADSHQLLRPELLQHHDLKDPHQRALKSSVSSWSCSKVLVGVCDMWE